MPVAEQEAEGQVAPIEPFLNSTHRCDRGGEQAVIYVTMKSGMELLFCKHHFEKHEDVLREQAIDIHDESKIILGG